MAKVRTLGCMKKKIHYPQSQITCHYPINCIMDILISVTFFHLRPSMDRIISNLYTLGTTEKNLSFG